MTRPIKQALLILISFSLFACGGESEENTQKKEVTEPEKGTISSEFYGQWTGLVNASDSIYINQYTLGSVVPKADDANIIIYIPEGKESGDRYVRSWRAGTTTSISGKISELGSASVSSSGITSLSSGIGGIANIEVVLLNINNGEQTRVTTNEDGEFVAETIEPGDYELEAEDSQGNEVSAEDISAAVSDTQVGTYTLVEEGEVNFKSNFTTTKNFDYSFRFHAPFLFADFTPYTGKLKITNIGGSVAEGVNATLDFNNPAIFSAELVGGIDREKGTWDIILNSMDAGDSLELEIENLRLNPQIEDQKEVEIPITLRDSRGNIWEDSYILSIYKRKININVKAKKGETLYGKLFFPDSSVIHFDKPSNYTYYSEEYPYLPGESYIFLLYSQGSESPYSIHIDRTVDDSIETFTDTNAFEPDDIVENATLLTLGDDHTSYISKEDFDYIEIQMPEEVPEEFQGVVLYEVKTWQASSYSEDGNGDSDINPGESFRFRFSVYNRGASDIEINYIHLSTDDEYLNLVTSDIDNQFIIGEHSVEDNNGYSLGHYDYLSASDYGAFEVAQGVPGDHIAEITAVLETVTGYSYTVNIPIEIVPIKADMQIYGIGEIIDGQYSGSAGNSDNIINPGETIMIGMAHQNTGDSTTYDVQISLETESAYITLGKATYSTLHDYSSGTIRTISGTALEEGDTVTTSSNKNYNYSFTVSDTAPSGEEVVFDVNYQDRYGNTWVDQFSITIE